MWLRLKPWVTGLFLAGIVALCLYLVLPIQNKIKLGLDLQGGASVLMRLNTSPEVPKITSDIQAQVEQVYEGRLNRLGVSEPQITTVGTDRILVELPNVKNPDVLVAALKDIAKLDFKIMPAAVEQRAASDPKYAADPNGAYKDSGPIVYTGAELKSAASAPSQSGGTWQIDFTTKDPKKFGELTQTNLGKLLAVFLDKQYKSSATIQGVITDNGQITGNFTEDDTIRIANDLNAGALPVSATVIENNTVGPILGRVDLEKSLYASIAGLGLVLLFMLVVYRLPGLLADIALIVYVLMLLGLFAGVHAVLTLPGIAGFVL